MVRYIRNKIERKEKLSLIDKIIFKFYFYYYMFIANYILLPIGRFLIRVKNYFYL